MLAAFNVNAQVDGFQLPYNPDSEPDGYIGVGDVLEVLSIFGSQFNVATLSADSSYALVLADPELSYWECKHACKQLGRQWNMIDSDGLATHSNLLFSFDSIVPFGTNPQTCWLDEGLRYSDNFGHLRPTRIRLNTHVSGSLDNIGQLITNSDGSTTTTSGCYCQAKVRPEREYTIVYDGNYPTFISKVQTKVDEGWFLSGGIMRSVVTSNSSSTQYHQALWRWED